jgi:hypothetical protein
MRGGIIRSFPQVMGVGKDDHAGGGSLGGAKGDADHPAGVGHPPLADRALS